MKLPKVPLEAFACQPFRPPGMSTPQLQYEYAQAVKDLPILQWRDPQLDFSGSPSQHVNAISSRNVYWNPNRKTLDYAV